MWDIITIEMFDGWYNNLSDADRTNVLASILVLQSLGPMLGRPHAEDA